MLPLQRPVKHLPLIMLPCLKLIRIERIRITFLEIYWHGNASLTRHRPLVTQALATQRLLFGEGNLTLANTLDTLALIQQGQGKLDAAEQSAREALRIAEKAAGTTSIDTIYLKTALADVLLKRKQYGEAITLTTDAMNTLESLKQGDHQYMASAEYLRAEALYASRRYAQAEPLLRDNISRWQQNDSPVWREARAQNLLGATLLALNKAEGVTLLQSSYQVLQGKDSGASAEILNEARARMLKHGVGQPQVSTTRP